MPQSYTTPPHEVEKEWHVYGVCWVIIHRTHAKKSYTTPHHTYSTVCQFIVQTVWPWTIMVNLYNDPCIIWGYETSTFIFCLNADNVVLCCAFCFALHRLMYLMFPVSLDFPFGLLLRYSLTFLYSTSIIEP